MSNNIEYIAKVSFMQVDQKRHHWPKILPGSFRDERLIPELRAFGNEKDTPVFQNPPNAFSGGVWTPQMPFQEVFGVANTYSQGIVFGRLEI